MGDKNPGKPMDKGGGGKMPDKGGAPDKGGGKDAGGGKGFPGKK